MNNIYKQAYIKLNQYSLTKVQKAMIYQQMQDVFDQMSEEDLKDECTVEDLIEDIFDYNNIEKKEKNNYKFISDNIFWGLLLILLAVLIGVTDLKLWSITFILCIPLSVYFLFKRLFLLTIICLSYIVTSFFGTGFEVFVGLLLTYLGLKLIFSRRHNDIKYHNFSEMKAEHKYKMRRMAHENIRDQRKKEVLAKCDENLSSDEEVLFIDNVLNGNTVILSNQKVNYINILNKFGGLELDLRNFEFPKGDLIINVDNRFGGLTIYINDEIEVDAFISSFMGGVDQVNKDSSLEEKKYKVYIQGKNKCGGISIA